MKQSMLLICLCAAATVQSVVADEAPAPSRAVLNEVRVACEADAKRLCAGVQA